ncbi:MAG: hypothetical protein EOO31_07560 [Comamonadaceae bacterium]|nr:MAG: hypothetical protein EOO31_07560 [Comamonadaceae bacterium]
MKKEVRSFLIVGPHGTNRTTCNGWAHAGRRLQSRCLKVGADDFCACPNPSVESFGRRWSKNGATYCAEIGEHALALLVNEAGHPLRSDAMRYRFQQAPEKAGIAESEFQFRDFRARAATEADDADRIRAAQALLGHTTEAMTADYIRHKVGRKAKPLR